MGLIKYPQCLSMGIADNAMLPEPLAAVAIVVGLPPGSLLAVLLPVRRAPGLEFLGEGG